MVIAFKYGLHCYGNHPPNTEVFPKATVEGGVNFHYYTQDYLDNNLTVIKGSTGLLEQAVAYYPYGAVIADLGTNPTKQPYKFGGKELITANGLNEYDFGARYYYPTVRGFTKPDQKAEKYPWLSRFLTSRTTAPSSTPCQTASFPHQPSRCRFLRNPAFCKPFQ